MNHCGSDRGDDRLYMPIERAVQELRNRRRDRALAANMHVALKADVPWYLAERECFVLARHVATPNNEALYVLQQAERYGATAIFSQDLSDKFTSVNNLKRRIAQPEICMPETNQRQNFRKVRLVDVPAMEGRSLRNVVTRSGVPLAAVHNSLFDTVKSSQFIVSDDHEWIDRNGRGRMREHYRRFLLLFIRHGILFEDFEAPSDVNMKVNVITPILEELQARFGVSPLIVRSHPSETENAERYFLAHLGELFDAPSFEGPPPNSLLARSTGSLWSRNGLRCRAASAFVAR